MDNHSNEISDVLQAIKLGQVTGITADSRQVQPGYVFVAIPGSRANGCEFIGDAIKKGALFVVVPKNTGLHGVAASGNDVHFVEVPDVRDALGRLAAAFYGDPASSMDMIGITGTNGKTTTSYLLESVFKKGNKNVGVIGTISTRFDDIERPSTLTTPDVVSLHRTLQEMQNAHVNTVVMEVSSHALDQKRVAGCRFKVAIFTNLTHDHLDYHRDMEAYYQAKRRLFMEYAPDYAIINIDDAYGKRLWQEVNGPKISYGLSPDAMVHPVAYTSNLHGIQMEVSTPLGLFSITSSLVGRFNVLNILAAIATSVALQVDRGAIVDGIAALLGVPGRLEAVRGEGVHAFVDYAHTPDALLNVLTELSSLKGDGRLLCVFGCGGDRDAAKRPVMARIVAEVADEAIMTSDNPRSEDPCQILLDMWNGLFPWPQERRCRIHVEPDRKKAIGLACSLARVGDCILVAGKGHETYQEIAGVRYPFDDRVVVRDALKDPRKILPEFSLEDITNALGVTPTVLPTLPVSLHGISTDSRKIYPSQIFWALNGPRFRGADFVSMAIKRGAIAAVVNQEDKGVVQGISRDFPVFFVPDTLYALGEMAGFHRNRSGYRVVGVTGSCGKTTTKEMIAAILGQNARVIKTQGNFNNLIGLPLTILGSSGDEDWAVLEMGMNQHGEIARLCEIAGPDVGVITNVRPVHLEGVGDIQGVLYEKTALWRSLGAGDVAVVNLDDPLLKDYAASLSGSVGRIGYTLDSRCEIPVWLQHVIFLRDWAVLDNGSRLELAVRDIKDAREQLFSVNLQLIGLANLQNALCAAATAFAVGCNTADIQRGLEKVAPVKGRLEIKVGRDGLYVIDDTYNANPASMELALQTLKLWGKGRLWAVVGDMFELGENAMEYHAEVGRLAGALGLHRLIFVGSFARTMADAAVKAGTAPDAVEVYGDTEALVDAVVTAGLGIQNELEQGAMTLLVKASRGMGLERVVDALITIKKD